MNTTGKYILEGHKAIECNDLMVWARWLENADRLVEKTVVSPGVEISTVFLGTGFLGLDHQFGDGEPLLFETMVFGGKHDQEMERYSTWEQAAEGHIRWAETIKDELYNFKEKTMKATIIIWHAILLLV